MKEKISLTVLMTVYNGGEYLYPAVASVLKQIYRDFELLIVDDASIDTALEHIKNLKDPRVRIYRNPQNIGQTRSLNVGLRMAHGDYIARMDADDLAYPNWLQEQVKVFNGHRDCVVISPRAVVIDSKDRIVKELNVPSTVNEIILKSIFASPINHVGCLMQRKAVLDAGGYDEQYRIVADYALWSKLISEGQRVITHPQVLVAVRAHAASVSMLEADKRVIPEMTAVMKKNIEALTPLSLQEADVLSLWQVAYTGHTMRLAQFLNGMGVYRSVYSSINHRDVADVKEKDRFFHRQERIFFLKRIWGLIKTADIINARATAAAYIKLRGPVNIFTTIWFFSFLGKMLTVAVKCQAQVKALLAYGKVTGNGRAG